MPDTIVSGRSTCMDIVDDVPEVLRRKRTQLVLKRCFDVIISLTGLLILSPLFLVVAIAIMSDSRGPVIFRQTRVGRYGKHFRILKFRTMNEDSEKHGMQITVGDDSRITRVGGFLRRTKMDELPQLINILRGEMSFVGPRPEVPAYVELYTEEQRQVLMVRPGLTDPASIKYRHESCLLAGSDDPEETYVREIMPSKLELSLQYIVGISLLNDIHCILTTTALVLTRPSKHM